MVRHHFRLAPHVPADNLITWNPSKRGPGRGDISINFLANPTKVASFERLLRSLYHRFHMTDAQIRQHMTQRQNVVIHRDSTTHVLTEAQIAKIVGCLRRATTKTHRRASSF